MVAAEDESDSTHLIRTVIAALNSQSIPDRPSIEQTIQWVDRHQQQKRKNVSSHGLNRRTIWRVLISTAALAVTLLCALTFSASSQNAFAQVLAQIKRAENVRFTVESTGGAMPKFVASATARSPDVLRIDFDSPDGVTTNITNYKTNELVSYQAKADSAKVDSIPHNSIGFDIVRQLRKLDVDPQLIPDEENNIEGSDLYSFAEGAATGRLWVDQSSKLPIRVETKLPDEVGGGTLIFRDFNWNVEAPDSLFEMPQGRTVTRSNMLAEPTEEELVSAFMLRNAFTQKPYPEDFLVGEDVGLRLGRIAYALGKTREENSRIQAATLGDHFAEIGLSPAEFRDADAVQRRIDYLCMKLDQWESTIRRAGKWVGGGVLPGEPKLLCWWRDAGGIRVLTADLTIQDAEQPPSEE